MRCSTCCGGRFGYASWIEWPAEYAQREQDALTKLLTEHGRELAIEQVVQFFFNEQWCALRGVLRGAQDSHPGRCGDLRELRQRRCVDASGDVRAG